MVHSLALCLVASMLVASTQAANLMPVAAIEGLCAPLCVNTTRLLTPECANCVWGAGFMPVWNATHQPAGTMYRFPLYEYGLKNVMALPLAIAPDDYFLRLFLTNLEARKQYSKLPLNVTICQNGTCVTRDTGPQNWTQGFEIGGGPPFGGLCYNDEGWVKLTSACDGRADPLQFAQFNNPEDLAMIPDVRRHAEYLPTMRAYARNVTTNVTWAQDSIWRMNQIGWSFGKWFVAATCDHLHLLAAAFGSDWKPEWNQTVLDGKMTFLNFTWVNELEYGQREQDTFQPWPLMVFERMVLPDGKLVNRCLLIQLTDPRGGAAPINYSPEKSPTAFILAAAYSRGALSFHQIWVGHFFTQHQLSGGFHYALYNSVDAGVPVGMSRHPLRMMLDQHTEPTQKSSIELATYRGINFPAYTAIQPPYFLQTFNLLARTGPFKANEPNDMYNLHPLRMTERTGMKVEDYTSPAGRAWDLYEGKMLDMEVWYMVEKYAKQAVNVYYKSDKDVKQDAAIQTLVEVMKDPLGANLGRISASNKITTKAELTDLVAQYIHLSLLHNVFHLQDYSMESFYNIAASPTRMDLSAFFSPTQTFTLPETMSFFPNADNIGKMLLIAVTLNGVDPVTNIWVPKKADGTPDWKGNVPYPARTNKGDKANKLLIAFRKEYLYYMKDGIAVSTDGIRDMKTDYDFPFQYSPNIDY